MKALESLGFSGALLVAKDGQVIHHQAYGWRDAQNRQPYTLDTASTVGSITKQFTATAILALEEEGKLHTDDLITKYFPNVPEDKRGITLHQLLTHSAGFRGALGDDYEAVERDAYVRLALDSKLLFPPGTAYEYSNVGYSLLGAIIEQVTGQSYERYLHDRLFARAGMTQTGYRIPKFARLAHGVRNGEPWGTSLDKAWAADGPYWHLRANGGILSTPADMYRWHQALNNDTVLTAASRKKLFTPYVLEGEGADSSYAYGWAVFPLPDGKTLIAHDGGNGIFAADFRRYVDDDLMVFITSNDSEWTSIAASRWVSRIARGENVTIPPTPVATAPAVRGNADYDVRVNGNRVVVTPKTVAAMSKLAGDASLPEQIEKDVTTRTKTIAEGLVRNDLGPLVEAFHGGMTREELEARQKELETELGKLQAANFLGARRLRNNAATLVELRFQRGTRLMQYLWGPDGLQGLRTLDALPSTTFVAISDTELTAYDLRSGQTRTVRVQGGELQL